MKDKYHFYCSGCDHYFQSMASKTYCNSCGKRLKGQQTDAEDEKLNEEAIEKYKAMNEKTTKSS